MVQTKYGSGDVVLWNNYDKSCVFRIRGVDELQDGVKVYRVDVLAMAGDSAKLDFNEGDADVVGPTVDAMERGNDSRRVNL